MYDDTLTRTHQAIPPGVMSCMSTRQWLSAASRTCVSGYSGCLSR